MAREDGDLRSAAGEPLSFDELLEMLGRSAAAAPAKDRARACYLSSSEGWRDAVKLLGGAFASEISPLTDEKEE